MKRFAGLLTWMSVAFLCGCQYKYTVGLVPKASCVIQPTRGNQTRGTIVFVQMDGYVRITGEITGLTPGKHGFHVHEFGDVNCADGKCAGGHFNPEGVAHGAPGAAVRHVGDLGNIEADAGGKAVIDMRDDVIQLGGRHCIIGRAIILHAKPDDFGQPTGHAGARVGMGIIGIAKPEN